ncbi:calponin homology domain-containing protein DDB_G0272472-like isoform X2 [Mizuhopecten yessoensis]|uniref:calponin homology domain-containing protein DDB_G0272472-like isoform X2 n=1 Tax=Mizuhopecten yessoensis TaxID=6573 RepID=UPI000B45DCF0|nr:calponin homology domain-containing protein DDB_G0272472-like isoform X2 [Mizuhopecten yessoensis]
MFSPLSRGYGTWSGELYDPYKGVTDTESLPCIEPGENTHRHGVTVGLGPRASTTMSMRSGKDQPLTCTLTPRSDGKLNIPKTFTTRKGALILFSSQEDGDNGSASTSVSRSSSRQKSALSKKFSALETCSTLGTLDRLSLSVLQYGDQEEYDRENVSIADEKNKMVLNFIHSLDEREMDSRVRPGSELSSYLRDLKYSGRHGATYLPRSRETMELRALLQGLQDNKWPMSYSSTEGAPAVDRSNTYAEQFTRPSSRGSTRPGSPGSGTATPRSILSARKLTASLKSLNPYRQPSIVDDSELDDEQSTSTHPTISAKVTRKSPLQDDLVRSGSASPQRSWTQRLGPTSITGSIEEEQPSDGNQGWRGSSLGTYLTDNTPKAPGVTDPSHNDEGRNSYSPKELGDGHLLMEQGDRHLEAEEGDGHGEKGVGLDHLSEGSDGSDVEMLYTAGNGCVDGSVDIVDGDGIVSASVVSPSPNMQHDKSALLQQHDNSSPSPHPEQSLSCDLQVVVDHTSPLTHPQLSEDNKLSSQVTDPGVDRLSVADDGGDVVSSITGVSEDTTEPVTIKVDINTLITGPIPEENQEMAEFSGSEVKSNHDMDRNNVNLDVENSQLVKTPTGTESELNDVTGEKGYVNDLKSPDGSMSRVSPSQKRDSSGGKGSPTAAITTTKGGSRQSSAKRVLSGRKSPRREATPVKQSSRQSSAKSNADRSVSQHETEATETLVAMEAKTEAVDLEDVASVASSVLVEQDIVLPAQDDTGDVSNGETASLPVDGVAQPLVPQYTGSMANGGGLMILDSVPSVPVVSPHSSRPVSRTSSRPASYKTGQLPLEEEPPIATPKSAEPPEQRVEEKQDKKIELKEQKNEQKDDHKMSDTASLSVGKTEETTPKPPEGGKKGQQRRGHLPRGKKAKKDVTKAIDISSVQPDEEEKPKEHEITVYKTVKVAAQKEETIIPDFITEESARHKEESKEALEQQMVEMSKIVDNAMSGTVLEEDEGGLTDMELALAQKQVLERMAEAKEKMGQVDNPQPPKVEKPVKGTTGKKGGKKNIEKKVVDTEKEKLKEMRRVEKEKRLEEAKTLQSKIDKQQALRKAKEKEARDRGKLTTDNVELELEMERLEREAEEIQQAEDDVRQALAESRKKQRDERDTRRKADLERKKQLAIERRDKEKKIMEKAKNKELEMLEKIEDANVRKRQREEEELKEEEEERLAQERLEEEMREAERLAEEEEDKLRELERQAEEEAMQRLIDEREEATRKKRQIEEQKRLVEEEEDRKREIIIKEERRLEEERSRRAEEEDRKLQEEKRRLAELQRIESEAREQMQKELAHRREMALSRRDRNLEARSNMTRLKHSQGITQPWVWSYFIQWPMETYNIPIGGEPDDKKKKRPKPKAKR